MQLVKNDGSKCNDVTGQDGLLLVAQAAVDHIGWIHVIQQRPKLERWQLETTNKLLVVFKNTNLSLQTVDICMIHYFLLVTVRKPNEFRLIA
jgi:desulfoferrodoxin (superoxide reductase-like protein)